MSHITVTGSSTNPRQIQGFPNRKQRIHHLGKIRGKCKYVPSLYENPDPQLSTRIKRFLCNPPLNSEEYFLMMSQDRRVPSTRSPNSRPSSGISTVSLPVVSEKLRPLLPEKRTIHEMMLPSISERCTLNFNSDYRPVHEPPIVDPSVSDAEKLPYCRYLRTTSHPHDYCLSVHCQDKETAFILP